MKELLLKILTKIVAVIEEKKIGTEETEETEETEVTEETEETEEEEIGGHRHLGSVTGVVKQVIGKHKN